MSTSPTRAPTWRYLWRLLRFAPGLFVLTLGLRAVIFGVIAQAHGLLTRAFFDRLTGQSVLTFSPWGIVALIVALALARVGLVTADIAAGNLFRFTAGALLRKNLFGHILGRPGARAVPGSPGEALSRLHGDVDEVAGFLVDRLPFQLGFGLFALVALGVMLSVNAQITLIVFLPLGIVTAVVNAGMKRLEKYQQANRQAAGAVSGLIGEMFGAVQAIQVATAEARVIRHFVALNAARRRAALKARLLIELMHSVFGNAINLGTGLILLLVGRAMQAGHFTVGDLALFTYYLTFVTSFTFGIGQTWAQYKQVGVSLDRLITLLQGAPAETLVRHGPVYLRGPLPEGPCPLETEAHRLERLDAHHLSYHYPDTGRGIADISLSLPRGSFTVITGRVGSGKTTLLRVLLGLLPHEAGELAWNGQPVPDPASFLVPPRAAYTAQVPLLFSESLKDNLLLGLPESPVKLQEALRLAVLEQDLTTLEQGLETTIGAKGVKLSGGQRQRAAAARMFLREPELLVFDDLSSALDVETERQLWERLSARGETTCLVVSHRRPALRRADHIIVLKEGRVEAEGTLEELLAHCEEMQRLWRDDTAPEGDLTEHTERASTNSPT